VHQLAQLLLGTRYGIIQLIKHVFGNESAVKTPLSLKKGAFDF